MPTYAIGDVHGQLVKLLGVLQTAGLVDLELNWSGGTSRLWFVGDLFDRGPSGLAVCDLVMRLEREAARAGGFVGCLLGNHEVLLLSAHRLGRTRTSAGMSFRAEWLHAGGRLADLQGLGAAHLDWLERRPLLALEGETLLCHADSAFYAGGGSTLPEVNARGQAVLTAQDPRAWDELIGQFARRLEYWDETVRETQLERMLGRFGGKRILHGHTPISFLTGQQPEEVSGALEYAGGRVINVDGGMMYKRGHGFVYALPELLP